MCVYIYIYLGSLKLSKYSLKNTSILTRAHHLCLSRKLNLFNRPNVNSDSQLTFEQRSVCCYFEIRLKKRFYLFNFLVVKVFVLLPLTLGTKVKVLHRKVG